MERNDLEDFEESLPDDEDAINVGDIDSDGDEVNLTELSFCCDFQLMIIIF